MMHRQFIPETSAENTCAYKWLLVTLRILEEPGVENHTLAMLAQCPVGDGRPTMDTCKQCVYCSGCYSKKEDLRYADY